MAIAPRKVGGSRQELIDAINTATAAITALSTAITTASLTVTGASVIDGADVTMANLPTSDPTVAGQLWSNSGVLTVSAG